MIIIGMVIMDNREEKDTIKAEYSLSLLKFSAKIVVKAPAGIACIKISVFMTMEFSPHKIEIRYSAPGKIMSFMSEP